MNTLSAFLALMVTLSMATERVTEAIKGLPFLSNVLARENKAGSWQEEAREAAIHIIAIAVGTGFAWAVRGTIATALNLGDVSRLPWALWLLLGGLASGGSAIWNSTLDVVRTIKQQKEALASQANQLVVSGPAATGTVTKGRVAA